MCRSTAGRAAALRAGGASASASRSARRVALFPGGPRRSCRLRSAAGPTARMLDRLESCAARRVAGAGAHRASRCGTRFGPRRALAGGGAARLDGSGIAASTRRSRCACCTRRSTGSGTPPATSATDFSFYTKRATLAGIYAADVALLARGPLAGLCRHARFLDRRLETHAARIGARAPPPRDGPRSSARTRSGSCVRCAEPLSPVRDQPGDVAHLAAGLHRRLAVKVQLGRGSSSASRQLVDIRSPSRFFITASE